MENMRFKVGDRVRIKSLDWYNKNKSKSHGTVVCCGKYFEFGMKEWCAEIMTILEVDKTCYIMTEDGGRYLWTDEMIEGLVEEEMPLDKAGQITDFEYEGLAYTLPEGYQFKDENGNVINATKIVLEKKKREYPKTYEECAKLLNTYCGSIGGHNWKLLSYFQKLIICRDAYWKIAGEEMGLGKPWRPDYTEKTVKYCLRTNYGRIVQTRTSHDNHPFSFPTEEMRDAFYENFKELIEQCKELL